MERHSSTRGSLHASQPRPLFGKLDAVMRKVMMRLAVHSPGGAKDCSPRRKPGVVRVIGDSPGGAEEPWPRTDHLNMSFFRPYRGWMSPRSQSPGLRLGLQSIAPPGLPKGRLHVSIFSG